MKYRKKPIVIEAFQLGKAHCFEIPLWMSERDKQWKFNFSGGLTITTLEGVMEAMPGDWIIKGVKGELYPCKPDIFSATYEAVEE